MKKEIEILYSICELLNERFDNHLLDKNELDSLKNNISDYLNRDVAQLNRGIEILSNLDINKLSSSTDESYVAGFTDVYSGLTNFIDYLQDLDEMFVKLNRKFMLISGEITEDEYKRSLEIVTEEIDSRD